MRGRLEHILLSFLMTAGLLLPVLHVLSLSSWIPLMLGVSALVIPLVSLSLTHRISRLVLFLAAPCLLALWLLAGGGTSTLLDVVRAMALEASGVHGALPLFGQEACILVTVFFALIAMAACSRSSGILPSLMCVFFVLVLLWQFQDMGHLWMLFPAVLACLAVSSLSLHENLRLHTVIPAALALTLLSFAIVPAGGVEIPPLKKAADEMRQRIMDYLFFTEPRNVFSLAGEGYYPAGPGQLGGKAEPSTNPVMVVKTPVNVYLRGSIRNEYNGRAWLDTTGGRRYLWVSPRWLDTRKTVFDASLPGGSLQASPLLQEDSISVRMVSDSTSSIFVPQRIRDLTAGGDLIPYFNIGSEVFVTRDLTMGDTWTVTAPLLTSATQGIGDLIQAAAAQGDPARYAQILKTYTVLPDHLQTSLYDLARTAVQGRTTPFERALAIQGWLKSNCRYSLDVEAIPESTDFVSYFLLRSREGYCTYFASAMTVMCRMMGIPARYVEGYLARPDASGYAYVTGESGHAWTEVYFDGFGWLTFDATPGISSGAPSQVPPGFEEEKDTPPTPGPSDAATSPPPSASPTLSPTPSPSPSPSPSQEERPTPTPSPETEKPQDESEPGPTPTPERETPPEEEKAPPSPLWWILILLLLLILALVLRYLATRPDSRSRRARDITDRYRVWLQDMADLLHILHISRGKAEPLVAYGRRVDISGVLGSGLSQVLGTASMLIYSHREPLEEDLEEIRALCREMENHLHPTDRLRLILRRMFVPMKTRTMF